MRRAVGGLLAVGLLLTGCSGNDVGDPTFSDTPLDSSPAPTGPTGPAATPGASTGATAERDENLEELAAAAQSAAAAVSSAAPLEPRTGPVLGADISWPQCPKGLGIPHKMSEGLPLPTPDSEYVVIGLTNGPGFHANPCLADQVAYAELTGLLTAAYSVISWPDADALTAYGSPEKAGYAQAEFNVASMKAAGLATPVVWLDVEHVPYYDWPADPAANAQVVSGAAQGYVDAGYRIGIYSTPYLWESVVGDLALGVPEWRAAGQTSQAEALARCGPDWSIQGGPSVLGQWVEGQRDRNITCPGVSADLGTWFAAPPSGG